MFGKIMNRNKKKEPTHPVKGASVSLPSVQAWLPFYDVNMNLIWRRDNQLVAGVHVKPINLGLLSEKEQKRKIHLLFEVINSLENYWMTLCLQRPVDLDEHMEKLAQKRDQETHYVRRRILDSSIRNAARIASSGEAIDMEFYVLLTGQPTSKNQNVDLMNLNNKAAELADSLSSAELESYVCDDHELREALFIFLNPIQSAYERAPQSSGPYLPPVLNMGVRYG